MAIKKSESKSKAANAPKVPAKSKPAVKSKVAAKKTSAVKAIKPAASPSEKVPTDEKPAKAVRKTQKAKVSSSYSELLKQQTKLDEIKKNIKADIFKAYEEKAKEMAELAKEYHSLFQEDITKAKKAPKGIKADRKGKGSKGAGKSKFSHAQIESFIEQKTQGIDVSKIKIDGKNAISVRHISEAYDKSDTKDVDSILALL